MSGLLTKYLIDSHLHLQESKLDVLNAIISADNPSSWQKITDYADKYNYFYTLGLHPWYCSTYESNFIQYLSQLKTILANKPHNLVAIGEIGLDKLKPNLELQNKVFCEQIEIAESYKLPIILHSVKMHNEILAHLRNSTHGGIIHGFNSSTSIAKNYIDLGFKIGVGSGLLTNPKLQDCVSLLPIEAIVIETDADLPIYPTNLLGDIATVIASIYNISNSDSISILNNNINSCLHLNTL